MEPIDLVPATEDEIAAFETGIGVRLAEQHCEFLREHGGGRLLFLDVCPVNGGAQSPEDLYSANSSVDASDFVAVAPVGTGDYWGFTCRDGRCEEQVSFRDHESGAVTAEAEDFYSFLTRRGFGEPAN